MQNLISWQQFGLKKNPYDTLPLVEGGDIPIEDAFVGRKNERSFIDNLLVMEDRLCFTVCGDVGVGKTSLINFQKFIWKYKKEKLLFSARREIEANNRLLNKKNFIIEIIGSILQEIKLKDSDLLKKDLLKKLSNLVDISQTLDLSFGANVMGYGGSVAGGKNIIQPIQLSESVLEGYFQALLDFIMSNEIGGYKYSGLIIHINNFDIVMNSSESKQKVIHFFNEMRNFFQKQNVYFIFLGPKNFYKDIISTQKRVKSIFYQTPLQIKPLSKKEIVQAFDKRMQLLQSDEVSGYTKPVEDTVIFQLYDLYDGDIRSVMGAVRDIIGQLDSSGEPLKVEKAMVVLGRLRWEEINSALNLTPTQIEVLKVFIESEGYLSQKELKTMLNKQESNVSGYYFPPLKDNDIIEEKGRKGKEVFFGLTSKYLPLKMFIEYQEKLKKKVARDKVGQPSLLDNLVGWSNKR